MQLEPFHRIGDQRAGNGADHKSREGADKSTRGAAGDEPADPAIGADGDIGAAETQARDYDGCENSGAGRERRIDGNQNNAGRGGSRKQQSAGGIESQPSEQGQKTAE